MMGAPFNNLLQDRFIDLCDVSRCKHGIVILQTFGIGIGSAVAASPKSSTMLWIRTDLSATSRSVKEVKSVS